MDGLRYFFAVLAALKSGFLRMSGGYATAPAAAASGLNLAADWTISIAVRLTVAQAGSSGYAFSVATDSSNQNYTLLYGFAGQRMELYRFSAANGSARIAWPVGTADGLWHRYSVVTAGNMAQLYLDGTAVGSPTLFDTDAVPNTATINLGCLVVGQYPLPCEVRDLKITAGGTTVLDCPLRVNGLDRSARVNHLSLGGSAAFA